MTKTVPIYSSAPCIYAEKVDILQEAIDAAWDLHGGHIHEHDGAYWVGHDNASCPDYKDPAAVSLGKRGRAVNSPAQQEASRRNGKKGGRRSDVR